MALQEVLEMVLLPNRLDARHIPIGEGLELRRFPRQARILGHLGNPGLRCFYSAGYRKPDVDG